MSNLTQPALRPSHLSPGWLIMALLSAVIGFPLGVQSLTLLQAGKAHLLVFVAMALAWAAAMIVTMIRDDSPMAMGTSYASVARPSALRLRWSLRCLAAGTLFTILLAGATMGMVDWSLAATDDGPPGLKGVTLTACGLLGCGFYLFHLAQELSKDESGPDNDSSAQLLRLVDRDPELDAVVRQWHAEGYPVVNRAVRQFASVQVNREVESAQDELAQVGERARQALADRYANQ